MVMLTTERLIIRDYVASDVSDLHSLLSNENNMYFLDDIVSHAPDETRRNLAEAMANADGHYFCVRDRKTNAHIGAVGYDYTARTPIGKVAHMGYFFRPEHHNRGYATEAVGRVLAFAFGQDDCVRVTTGCYGDNIPSRRVMEKVGFRKEGERIAAAWHDGRMKNRLDYALNRDEYRVKYIKNEGTEPDMQMRMDYNNMLCQNVGAEGITPEEIASLKERTGLAVQAMRDKYEKGGMDWRGLPYNQADVVKDIVAYVNEMKDKIDAFVVLGIGGSALGPIAVQQALNHPYYNELPREKRGNYPKLYVVDNVDPERLVYLFDTIDVTKCLFNVISKSGSTSETMSQFMIIQEILEEKLGKDGAREHMVCTTDAEKGNLIKIAQKEGYKTFFVPSGVGGRFSELTPVGLLPAAFCGVDIEGLLAGAAQMDALCQEDDVTRNPAYMYALLNYIGMNRGKNISVMMPYADSLKFMSDWYAQLWAESLGKQYGLDGKVVNAGQTPVKALGVTDQHSQVQLYAEGPYDKIIVLLGVDKFRETITIPKTYTDMPSLGFLGGITHNALIATEQKATEYALTKAGRPNMTLTLPEVNAVTVGQLIMFFEIATAFAGELLQINAFDQPGVEEGKNATYALFGRPGYEDKKKELDAAPAKNERYII